MKNARKELLQAVKNTAKIKCALITYGILEYKIEKVLKLNHTNEQYDEFLNSLDFVYDNEYGGQLLYGTVWLEDGTWLSRREHEGSEWWEHNVLPDIPREYMMKKILNLKTT